MDSRQILTNITDKDNLKDNLSFCSFYIALFEHFADNIQELIKSFYWEGCELQPSGGYKHNYSPKYKSLIVDRRVDDEGNKDKLKASMLWFLEQGAINEGDYLFFCEAKKQRNTFAHELTEVILRNVKEEEIRIFFDLFSLYKKIDKWWINEIEIPCSGDFHPGEYNKDGVESVIVSLFQIMVDVLYTGKSDEIKQMVLKFCGK